MRANNEDCEYRAESPSSQHNSLRHHLERAFKVTDLDPFRSFGLGEELDEIPSWLHHSSTHDQQVRTFQALISPSPELRKQDKSTAMRLSVSPKLYHGRSTESRETDSIEGELLEQPTFQLKSILAPDEIQLKLSPLKFVRVKLPTILNDTLSETFFKGDQDEILPRIENTQFTQKVLQASHTINHDPGVQKSASLNENSTYTFGHCERLPKLCSALIKVFKQESLSVAEYTNLSTFEEDLLNSLLQRKFLRNLKPEEMALGVDEKVDLINKIIRMKSNKRHEECYKFVLTRTLKHLKRNLELPDSNHDPDLYCYQFYFSQASNDLGLSLSEFYYPLTGSKQKRFNFKYFELIFRSKPFVEQVTNYVNNLMEKQYDSEINRKLLTLVYRWDKMVQEAGENLSSVEKSIKEYLLSNKRCKLPWTTQEVSEANRRFKKLLNRFSNTQ